MHTYLFEVIFPWVQTGHPEEASKQGSRWAAGPDWCPLWVQEERGGGAYCSERKNCEWSLSISFLITWLNNNYVNF